MITGGLILGTADLVFAMTFWGIQNGISPTRILRSVARGVLGADAFQGGLGTAVLGGVLHYFIATCMALTYHAVSRKYEALIQRPIGYGLVYGVLLYVIMSFVVLPLSAVGLPRFDNVLWVLLSVILHAGFGVICSVAARLASTQGSDRGTAP